MEGVVAACQLRPLEQPPKRAALRLGLYRQMMPKCGVFPAANRIGAGFGGQRAMLPGGYLAFISARGDMRAWISRQLRWHRLI
jgi:hypothetical protein